jgi:hypothetical protein
VDLCVVAYCQVHFYEVILFNLFVYCDMFKFGLCC